MFFRKNVETVYKIGSYLHFQCKINVLRNNHLYATICTVGFPYDSTQYQLTLLRYE